MGTLWIESFSGGLDTRRLPETTSGGVLIEATDGHITRGGEFEKRAAFVSVYNFAGTIGLATTATQLYAFGSGARPGTLDAAIGYMQLVNPGGGTLTEILSWDMFRGKLYVAAQFSNGDVTHFYQTASGVTVVSWYDGKARAKFRITGGQVLPATAARGQFDITGGTNDPANTLAGIFVGGVDFLGAAVQHTGDNATTAIAVAAQINAFTSSPDYTATANGPTVIVTAVTTGFGVTTQYLGCITTGDFTAGVNVAFAGGDGPRPSYANIYAVDGFPSGANITFWDTSNQATAADFAVDVNAHVPILGTDFTATASDDEVTLIAVPNSASPNGKFLTITPYEGFQYSPSDTDIVFAGGSDPADTYEPGSVVLTVGSKVYSLSGPVMYFSALRDPLHYTTDYTGAGFIDMSSEASGSEKLTAIARYQNFVAVFAEDVIQIWFVDPDPTLYRQVQELGNTGTRAPKSVTQYGDFDIFYLDESGLRSLRARDSSNSAATTDIGVPIDELVIAKIMSLTEDERRQSVIGLIEPRDGRFWLVMKDEIYVLSDFGNSKVSAWTKYTLGFTVTDAVVFNRKVYLRSGNTVYVYGGLGDELTYDATEAVAKLPLLDARTPTVKKTITGIDAALRGTWDFFLSMSTTRQDAKDRIARLTATTYNMMAIPAMGEGTHFSPELRSVGTGPALLGSITLHFTAPKSDDD